MGTIDAQGNLHDRTGRFTDKENSAPAGGLAGAGTIPRVSPELVRTAEYSIGVLREAFETPTRHLTVQESADGGSQVSFVSLTGMQHVVTLDERGDVTGLTRIPRGRVFAIDDPRDEERYQLQHLVNLARLEAAGIDVKSETSRSGETTHYVGARDRGWIDASEVNRMVRRDIASAVEYGALPDRYTYSVTKDSGSMTQSVNIAVSGVADADHFEEGEYGRRLTKGHAAEIERVLTIIGSQWQHETHDRNADAPFSNNYFLFVRIGTERDTKWQQDEKLRAAARRKARQQ